uniref:Proline-rich protein 7 n=1 Tax=Scophthalmus maximus TaxID=52904 RepID=A0A8D3E9I7_SCOMX
MVMSQGTYTFLACFAGFWLVWAVIVMLCCFCSFLQRRLKRLRDERLREQCLRTVEMEPLSCQPAGYLPPPPPPPPPQLPREPPQTVKHMVDPEFLISLIHFADTELLGKPPCYEEAVLMEDPPPPYSEVLADPRWGTFLKPARLAQRRRAATSSSSSSQGGHPPVFRSETSKLPVATVFPDRGYSSLIHFLSYLPPAHCLQLEQEVVMEEILIPTKEMQQG